MFNFAQNQWRGLTLFLEEIPGRIKFSHPRFHGFIKSIFLKIPGIERFINAEEPDITGIPYGDIINLDGIHVRLHEDLSPRQAQRLISGAHTRPERKLMLEHMEHNDILMELGGGIGVVSTAVAKIIGSERVFSYEANPYLEHLVQDTYSLNDIFPTMFICLLGEKTGVQTFHISQNFSQSSTLKLGSSAQAIEVEVKPFNEEIARIKPTFLVVDIEGGEQDLFQYADIRSVNKLMLELHPHSIGFSGCNRLRKMLRSAGFHEHSRIGRCFMYLRKNKINSTLFKRT